MKNANIKNVKLLPLNVRWVKQWITIVRDYPEKGPPFYLVIRVAERFSRLRGKDLRFPVIFNTVNIGSAPEIELPHPALHSSALTTELIAPAGNTSSW